MRKNGAAACKPLFETGILEKSGTDGYEMYRIPVLVTTGGGCVLAFCLASNPDRQTIFMRRSTDCGKTWSSRYPVVEGRGGESIHNPVAIAENKGETVHFLWHKNHERCFYQRSDDSGLTWSPPAEITYVFEHFRKDFSWRVFSAGPGHGIQTGEGRLITPVWMASGIHHRPSVVSTIYSDDGGKTWLAGEIIFGTDRFVNPNETTLVQLENGTVLASMRHESLTRRRAFAASADGAHGWCAPYLDMGIRDPVCHASLLSYSSGGKKGILLANCDWEDEACLRAKSEGKTINWSDDARRNLTVRFSACGGKIRDAKRVIEAKAGYSDLAAAPDGTILCLYEKGWMKESCILTGEIAVARLNIEWLAGSAE